MQTDKYCAKNIFFFEYLDTVTMSKHIWTFHRAENQIQKKLPLKCCRRNENFWPKPQKPILRYVCEDASKREKNNNNKLFKVPLE